MHELALSLSLTLTLTLTLTLSLTTVPGKIACLPTRLLTPAD